MAQYLHPSENSPAQPATSTPTVSSQPANTTQTTTQPTEVLHYSTPSTTHYYVVSSILIFLGIMAFCLLVTYLLAKRKVIKLERKSSKHTQAMLDDLRQQTK